jgi:hypothetical protein
MTPDAFWHWRERKAYTLDEAARALGLQPAHGRVLREGRSPDPACRRISYPSAGYGFFVIIRFIKCWRLKTSTRM